MDLIEDIGPILGIAAFLGFAILALLIVLQAREVRRLREWAGRAPERAAEADEAAHAATDARGDTDEGEAPGGLEAARARLAERFRTAWEELDRRSPLDPRWLVGALAAGVVALVIVTSGFGLLGGAEEPDATDRRAGNRPAEGRQQQQRSEPRVAVLNATQIEDIVPPVEAVPGLADVVADSVVRPADFRVATRDNAPAGEEETVVMFEPDAEETAQDLAEAIEADLGQTGVAAMTPEIRDLAGGAELALLVGRDDAEFSIAQ